MKTNCSLQEKISLEANGTGMASNGKGAMQSKKLQRPVKMVAAGKEEELFPVNWGVASPAVSFLPMTSCLVRPMGPK